MRNAQAEVDSKQILEALSYGIAGDDDTAWYLIRPIARRSDRAMYAVFCSLAASASFRARQTQQPGDYFSVEVENIRTGRMEGIDAFPPDLRFAVQFVTAWANRDEDIAASLYRALRRNPDDLAAGLRAIYEMAVTSLRPYVEGKLNSGDQ